MLQDSSDLLDNVEVSTIAAECIRLKQKEDEIAELEEKLKAKEQITKILEQADKEAQAEVSERWKYDMQSDSVLSKNIRPMVLIYLTVIFTALCFTDGNIGSFEISKEYIPIFQTLFQ